MGDQLRWGVIGASWIAEDWVIPALRETGAEVASIYSSSAERAASYAAKNAIPHATDSLAEMLVGDRVDAVYVSSTNGLHYRHVLAAAAAHKHVLCEKPMARSRPGTAGKADG